MKILHVIPCYKPAYVYAGVIESVSRLCEGLAEAGHVVHVFTTTANGKGELPVAPGKTVDVQGVKVIYFQRITKDPTHVSPQLWNHLRKNAHLYDAIHLHSWWNVLVIVSAWICILKGLKVIVSPRGMLSQYIFTSTRVRSKKWLHKLVGERALRRCVLHATASSELDECRQLIKGWNGFVLPNILLLSKIDVTRKANPAFTLLFLSRIHPKKGLELLLEAMIDLPFAVKLKIAGSGDESYMSELKARVDLLKLNDKVVWLGWKNRDEKFQELMNSDCFVLPSYNENFANVVIESLHVGTPVIISDRVGLAPFVREHDLGWISELTVQSVRQTIISAHDDVTKREIINKSGRQVVNAIFDQPVLIEEYLRCYSGLNANG